MMSDLNTKDTKLSSYITRSTVEHFRLYLNNKDLVNDKDVCFFCLKSIDEIKELKLMEFGFVEYFDYDFQFLTKLADSMGHEYSENEFIPRFIFSCQECKELINDPDRLFYLGEEENKKESPCPDCDKNNSWIGKWLIFIFFFHSVRYLMVN
tara:strand:+ start:604 stop:1059 length:456 start_codon:yes stop_codon:yes gene_type:complete